MNLLINRWQNTCGISIDLTVICYFCLVDTDRDFDPTAEMMIHDYDDEHTLEEEEALSGDSCSNELDDLQRVCSKQWTLVYMVAFYLSYIWGRGVFKISRNVTYFFFFQVSSYLLYRSLLKANKIKNLKAYFRKIKLVYVRYTLLCIE